MHAFTKEELLEALQVAFPELTVKDGAKFYGDACGQNSHCIWSPAIGSRMPDGRVAFNRITMSDAYPWGVHKDLYDWLLERSWTPMMQFYGCQFWPAKLNPKPSMAV